MSYGSVITIVRGSVGVNLRFAGFSGQLNVSGNGR